MDVCVCIERKKIPEMCLCIKYEVKKATTEQRYQIKLQQEILNICKNIRGNTT